MATSSVTSQSEENFFDEKTMSVNIPCERCCKPLSLLKDSNNNLHEVNEEESDDFVFIIKGNQGSAYKRDIIRPLLTKSSDLGRLNIELLSLMSDFPKVDHPLCKDCADNIIDHVDQELRAGEEDIEDYRQLMYQLEMEDEEEDVDELKMELQKYEEIEALLQKKLSEMETQKNRIKEEVRCLENDCGVLEDKMNKFCPGRQYLIYEDELCSLQNQITYVKNRHKELDKTQAFRFAFQIFIYNEIGVINGFRLGRLPKTPVAWDEINAAWGQTVLLLHSLSKLINFKLENCELVPMCNRSYVKSVQNNEVKLWPLFYFGGDNGTKQMEFDHAMVRFLEYFQKFKETIEEEKGAIRLPYPIKNSKIIDGRSGMAYSVKLHLNTEENWTRALKLMLTNLRWSLAWSSKIDETCEL